MPSANVTNVQVSCSAVVSGGSSAWIWEGGSPYAGAAGSYGQQYSAGPSNVPGARSSSVGWTDTSGNLWLYSGAGTDAYGNQALLNDIWMHNTSSNQWTWEGGSQSVNAFPNWGQQGVPASSNDPGARQMSGGWGDSSGNLYMYAGSTLGYEWIVCNDLWYYNIQTHNWVWLSGPTLCNAGPNTIASSSYTWQTNSNVGNGLTPVYGTQGVPSSSNAPGARKAPAQWEDASGNLWVFGGITYNVGGHTYAWLNDLWRYQPNIVNGQPTPNGMWTYMGGSQTTNTDQGVYPPQTGMSSTSYHPGAREEGVTWTDNQGNLWLFGGHGPPWAGTYPSYYNDLWKYNIASGQWTWVSGSNSYIFYGNNGNYGSGPGSTGPGLTPGARMESVSWVDSAGNLWLFGGSPGEGTANNGVDGTYQNYNDTWMFSPSTGYWTYVSGPNYINAPASCTGVGQNGLPGARAQASWGQDLSGHVWMFGGDGQDCSGNQNNLGDLWKY
jgi:hypothetical protein